jgi:hypothetical protein
MKKIIAVTAIILFAFSSCNTPKKGPIEGTWKLIYMQSASGGTSYEFKQGDNFKDYKIFGKQHFFFIGKFKMADSTVYNSGGGTYVYDKGVDTESIEMHQLAPGSIGKTEVFDIKLKGDTLIQSTPGREKGSDKDGLYEMYLRVE